MGDLEELITLRRKFHRCAEIGWLEFETSIYIINYLNKLGLEVLYGKQIHGERMGLPKDDEFKQHKKKVINRLHNIHIKKEEEVFRGYTGAIGILNTKRQGKTIALRFDIDSNCVFESNSKFHKPYMEGFISYNNGMMHACGHDCHIAIGLKLAKELCRIKDSLCGKIIFIFQPAEEGVRGAKSIVDSGMLNNIDYFLSSHIGFMGKQNEIICGTEGFLATTKLDIFFYGKASHAGANPEKGRNALLAGANCTLSLYTLNQFSKGITRINVGKFNSGTGRNIIPDKAKLEIETRGENDEVNLELINRVYEVVKGISEMYGVNYEIKRVGNTMAYNNINENFNKFVYDCLKKSSFKIILKCKFGASEDVTYMMRHVEKQGGKSIYMIIGTNRINSHHSCNFDIDEKSLENGFKSYLILIKKLNFIK